MATILNTLGLPQFAATLAVMGLTITVTLGLLAIRFAPVRRQATVDRRQSPTEEWIRRH